LTRNNAHWKKIKIKILVWFLNDKNIHGHTRNNNNIEE
jgi:hypothetical protein